MHSARNAGRRARRPLSSLAILLPLAACTAPPGPQQGDGPLVERRVEFLLGNRSYDDALPDAPVLEDLNEALALGVEFSYQRAEDFVGFELGLAAASSDDDVVADIPPYGLVDLDLELSTSELYAGVVKTFRIGERIRPYLGLGLALVLVEGELSSDALGGSDTQDDLSPAGYVHAGVLFDVWRALNVGLDGRAVLGTDLDLDGLEVDADYLQLALVVGWSF